MKPCLQLFVLLQTKPCPVIRPLTDSTNNLSPQQHPYFATQSSQQQPYSATQFYMNSYETASRYNETTSFSQPLFVTRRDQENLPGSIVVGPTSSIIDPTSNITPPNVPVKLSNRWSFSETRMLIEEVGKQQQALQRVKDPREKGRIWDKIITNIQTSEIASLVLKERTKTSIQQKWDSLLQKYCDIKDQIASTGEELVHNNGEFFDDIDEYLRKDPSVTAPITSDSFYGIKRKSVEDQDDEKDIKKRKSTHAEEEKTNMEELRTLIKEQTETIAKIMNDQYVNTSEMQQKQHDEQMDIFRQFLLKL
ncbi:trihelix transcription factor gt-3a-like: PROVISIONAL [Gigaspora margarita]|uniref:Trihelix transcription factor gt-3a-like: PROVISIONAL n=1 Tax=Gigaspora margarita TaxID=4874 RepID=A0A8H4AZB2_GIGMA|nr:trihelix transcription factor gt-3a-like: PROVISIONAL [Gigaspora margarita]